MPFLSKTGFISLKDNDFFLSSFHLLNNNKKKTPLYGQIPSPHRRSAGSKTFFAPQNLSQTHMLIDLIQEVKEKGYKLRICPPVETNLVHFSLFFSHIYTQDTIFGIVNNFCFVFFIFQSPLTVTLPSPEPLTAAMFLFLLNMKEQGKDPLNPKLLFNQLCQKYDAFLPYLTIKSSMTSA